MPPRWGRWLRSPSALVCRGTGEPCRAGVDGFRADAISLVGSCRSAKMVSVREPRYLGSTVTYAANTYVTAMRHRLLKRRRQRRLAGRLLSGVLSTKRNLLRHSWLRRFRFVLVSPSLRGRPCARGTGGRRRLFPIVKQSVANLCRGGPIQSDAMSMFLGRWKSQSTRVSQSDVVDILISILVQDFDSTV